MRVWVQLWVGLLGAIPSNLLKRMAGTTELEPAASAVTVQPATLARMGTSRPKLHAHKSLAKFCVSASWIAEHRFSSTCSG